MRKRIYLALLLGAAALFMYVSVFVQMDRQHAPAPSAEHPALNQQEK